MKDELKPCPWPSCGSKNVSIGGGCEIYWVGCDNCGALGPEAKTIEQAAALWNARASDWIPVGERLPAPHIDVPGLSVERQVVTVNFFNGRWYASYSRDELPDGFIVAWQSFPNAP